MSHNLNLIDDGCIFHSISGKCVRFKECFSEEKDNCLKDIRFLFEKGNHHLAFFKINFIYSISICTTYLHSSHNTV